jgi:hypothetical protein
MISQKYLSRAYIGILGVVTVVVAACGVDRPTSDPIGTTVQPGITMQGTEMQGMILRGQAMQGLTMQGFRFAGATLNGALDALHIERGELVATRGTTTLRGTALVGAQLLADVQGSSEGAPATAVARYQITSIVPEDAVHYDPTGTGNTWLYTLEQWVDDTASWQPACPTDSDGRSAAIPMTATWNNHGDRVESTTQFTFGCTTGVIAKCYRWGYRPWLNGYGHMAATHWTCTRLARADYCGDGVPHTRNGTTINLWDTLPHGGIQHHGLLAPLGMIFEAGWNTQGAVCLSRARWLDLDGAALAALCPSRLVPPGVNGTVCDLASSVLDYDDDVQMFNESYIGLDL